MIRLRHWLPLCVTALLLALPARSCGPDFPVAIFSIWPDGPYPAFAAGHIGVPLPANARTRNLVIAYDYLTQRPLTAADQKQAVETNKSLSEPWYYEESQKKTAPPSGFDTWINARAAIGPIDGYTPTADLETTRSADDKAYDQFPNCLDDAFANAARTLAARSQAHGPKDPGVIEWVRGQDAVFSNCGDGKPHQFYGPGQPPPPPLAPHLPATLTNAPLWLQQDRAYQLAAAHFYALDYDAAIAGFRAIAADTASPWSTISRYLIARAYVRQATVTDSELSMPSGDAPKQAVATAKLHQQLGLAQKELLAMLSEPRMASMHDAIASLLDYVNLRYDPATQAATLAERLHTPGTGNFGQSLIDLTYLRYNPYAEPKPLPDGAIAKDKTGMILWITTLTTQDKKAALAQFQATHNNAWLLAALTFAQPTDAEAPALIQAAQAVPQADPAWTAVTYHRLRLMPRNAATRDELIKLLPQITSSRNTSTLNLFTTLNAASAPTLEAWLAAAGRIPAAESYDGESDTTYDAPSNPSGPIENVCGTKVPPNTIQLLDTDAAAPLNTQFPLHLLATAAESSTLPANLRFQVAQATWTRAVLLDRPEIARRMTPLLIACRAAWKPVLTAYDAATTPEQRHAAGLLALMRFASTEPSVREGEERRNGFATYDQYRQNWWCSTVPAPGDTVDNSPAMPQTDTQTTKAPTPSTPLFLTPADLAEAHTEVAALQKIPNASDYFAAEALAWTKLHPKGPATPDILGEANRVLRNACRSDNTPKLAKALFDTLHRDYPKSSWTQKYDSWE
jgi:TolA-binding protein